MAKRVGKGPVKGAGARTKRSRREIGDKPAPSSRAPKSSKGRQSSKDGVRVRPHAPSKRTETAPPAKSKRKSSTGRQPAKGGKRVRPQAPPKAAVPAKRYRITAKGRAQTREAVELLRRHVHGYESSDGYDLRRLEYIDPKSRRRLASRAAKLRELTASPYDTVKARTKKERKNLHQFTGQRIRRAKHYIVHKPADNFKAHLVDGHVEIEGSFPGEVVSRSRFFLFPRRPRYPKELVAMARRLQKEMPDGFYTVLTAAHGDTGEPFERDQIINRLNEYLAAYEVDAEGNPTGFSEALLGFRYMSTTLKGAVVQRNQIDARRQKQREYNRKVRFQAEMKERRRTKRRKPRKGK